MGLLDDAKENIAEGMDAAKEKVGEAAEFAKDKAGDAADFAKDTMDHLTGHDDEGTAASE